MRQVDFISVGTLQIGLIGGAYVDAKPSLLPMNPVEADMCNSEHVDEDKNRQGDGWRKHISPFSFQLFSFISIGSHS